MKINCAHGYFLFQESRAGDLSDFVSTFGLELKRIGPFFTFAPLVEAPDFSIKGAPYMGNVATATLEAEGDPAAIFRANGLVYNFALGAVVPIASITATVNILTAMNYFVSAGLILPGSPTDGGKRVTDYAAHFSTDTMKFKYSEVIRG